MSFIKIAEQLSNSFSIPLTWDERQTTAFYKGEVNINLSEIKGMKAERGYTFSLETLTILCIFHEFGHALEHQKHGAVASSDELAAWLMGRKLAKAMGVHIPEEQWGQVIAHCLDGYGYKHLNGKWVWELPEDTGHWPKHLAIYWAKTSIDRGDAIYA